MKFPYVQYGADYLPIIPVVLSRGDACIATEALVDSGASGCIFDAQFADVLGIDDIEEGVTQVEFESVTGHRLTPFWHELVLEVAGRKIGPCAVAFSRHMPDNAVNILGQLGFFEHFPVTLTYSKKSVEIHDAGNRR